MYSENPVAFNVCLPFAEFSFSPGHVDPEALPGLEEGGREGGCCGGWFSCTIWSRPCCCDLVLSRQGWHWEFGLGVGEEQGSEDSLLHPTVPQNVVEHSRALHS